MQRLLQPLHCIYYRLAVACADSSSQIRVLQDSQMYLFNYGHFFKNSPKRLNIYAKTALKIHDLDTILLNKHKKVVRKLALLALDGWVYMHQLMECLMNM